MHHRAALLLLVCAALLGVTLAATSLRGVRPSAFNLYQGEYIECDGGKKVPISRVNDNYCDCQDGTDEPGTSACVNGKFFCANVGHRGAIIPSSWVDDDHCDCCDGSDEASGKCPNTCKEASKAHQESLANEIELQQRGLRLREAYVTHAKNERERHHNLIAEAESQYAQLEARANELEERKIATEEVYSAAHEAVEARLKAESEAKESQKPKGEEVVEKEEDAEEAIPDAEEDPSLVPVRDEYLANSAPSDSDAGIGPPSISVNYHHQVDNTLEFEEPTFWDMLLTGYADFFESVAGLWSDFSSYFKPLTDKEKANKEWMDARNDKDEVGRKLEEYRKLVNLDLGADGAYHGIYGTTYEFMDKEYTYKLNPFNDVLQTKPGHSSTLGRWKGWDEKNRNVMIYDGGDRCWGAPDRSTRVKVICGDENKLVEVQEPNKCEYSMTLRTPAACSQETLDQLLNGE